MTLPTLARVSFPFLILSVAACGAGEPSNVAVPPAPPAVVVPSATAAPAAPPDDPVARVNALVCGRRDPCAVLEEHAAGKDAAGRSVSAVLVFAGHEGYDDETGGAAGGPPVPPELPAADAGFTSQPGGELFGAETFGKCIRYEYWRVVREGEQILEADRVAEICNDGHGAAGVGEDEVKVAPNSIQISTSGGSNWRWGQSTTYSLSPFVRRSQTWSGYWSVASNREEGHIDWESFSGGTRWYSPTCGAGGEVVEPAEGEVPDGKEYAEIWIPSLPLDPTFLATGWKATRLDRCAASIDASGVAGHLLSGKASTAADAHVRVVASEGALFVEVVDDTVVAEDHLEVWVGPPRQSYDSHCLVSGGPGSGVLSWNVRMTDGRVTPGFGKPAATALLVECAADPSGVIRLRVVPPPAQRSLTIAYADSDGGKKIERRIATSRLIDGHFNTLGSVTPAGDHASCTVKNGALTPEMKPEPPSNP